MHPVVHDDVMPIQQRHVGARHASPHSDFSVRVTCLRVVAVLPTFASDVTVPIGVDVPILDVVVREFVNRHRLWVYIRIAWGIRGMNVRSDV